MTHLGCAISDLRSRRGPGGAAAKPGGPASGACVFLSFALFAFLAVSIGRCRADDFVPFVIPAAPAADSLIALPPSAPLEPKGERIVARNGRFFRGAGRYRVWGVNLCFGACFPSHADAERASARLAAGGVNSARFHHMDNSAFPRGIWDPKDASRLSPEALERLDYFLDQLARRGIAANLNLHVSRTHSRALGLPDTGTVGSYDKIVGIFTPALLEAQERYARDLLTHVNAYRKGRYADDPAVAFVEITNEDSLFMWGAEGRLRRLPEFYAKVLQGRYNAWLKARYGSTEKLRGAWGEGAGPPGQDLLAPMVNVGPRQAPSWRLEQHAGCRAAVAAAPGSKTGVQIEVRKADPTDWHLQFGQPGLAIKGGQFYTLAFFARSDRPRRLSVSVGQAHEPWENLGLYQEVDLGPQERLYEFGFTAKASDANGRVSFILGGDTAAVHLSGAGLRPGGPRALDADETIEAGTVRLFGTVEGRPRQVSRLRFLAETEKTYFDSMRRLVREELGSKALVTGTIVFGPLGLWAQSDMDFVDTHAYWHHPRFPGRPWDPANWTVEQQAMTDRPDRATLPRLAACRLAGKPFTVSEYNHPAPMDAQAECVPMIASFAAAQDWDGVWLFAYSHRTDDPDPQRFTSFFDIDSNPAKWGFMAAGAAIFRDGGLGALGGQWGWTEPGADRLASLAAMQARHDRDLLAVAAAPWDRYLKERFAIDLAGAARLPDDAGTAPEISWTAEGGRGLYAARGPGAIVWIGHAGGPADAAVRLDAPGFAAVTVTALDGKPFDRSEKVLVTACGRAENTGMEFSADRRTVGRNWGRAPVSIEAVAATVRLAGVDAAKRRCAALGPDGRPTTDVPLAATKDGAELRLRPDYRTMWYLIAPAAR